MNYVVNVDKPTHQITIHRASCPDYLEWASVKDPANGGWFGPYEVLEEARGQAQHEHSQLGWSNTSELTCPRCPTG